MANLREFQHGFLSLEMEKCEMCVYCDGCLLKKANKLDNSSACGGIGMSSVKVTMRNGTSFLPFHLVGKQVHFVFSITQNLVWIFL